MFERDHHVLIAAILQSLDADLLTAHRCYFGGGTAILLRFGEYRESVDIDFLVSDPDGFRALRKLLKEQQLAGIVRHDVARQLRDIRADQYGIRTLLGVGQAQIKLEIVREARFELENPADDDEVCGVPTLTTLDMATSKLLANSDRWADASTCSRDIIDLAMMRPSKRSLRAALEKASVAYDSVDQDLVKAFERLRAAPEKLDGYMAAMKMSTVPKAVLFSRLRELVSKLP